MTQSQEMSNQYRACVNEMYRTFQQDTSVKDCEQIISAIAVCGKGFNREELNKQQKSFLNESARNLKLAVMIRRMLEQLPNDDPPSAQTEPDDIKVDQDQKEAAAEVGKKNEAMDTTAHINAAVEAAVNKYAAGPKTDQVARNDRIKDHSLIY